MQEQLAKLYHGLLDRAPDERGFEFWLEGLNTGSFTLEGVIGSFLSSREFVSAVDTNTTDAEFVEMVYSRLLNRSADQDGRNYWLSELGTGEISRSGFVASVLESEEYTATPLPALAFEPGAYEPSAFQFGVASGDPTANAVVLWTHVSTAEASEAITVQVATDESFENVVGAQTATATASQDYTVKVDFQGLDAGTEYFYRFVAADGEMSSTGRTKTLPSGDVSQIDLAVFSCANYPAGFFNAYAEAAVRKEYDALLHLGDYIYEYGTGEYATDNAAQYGRIPSPTHEILTANDYSLRYKQYHSDGDLQDLRASAPMIAIWDDHETANDSYQTGAENHDVATEGDWLTRRDTALEAYYNWMPIREPGNDGTGLENAYRSFDFGDLLSLHMLETRLIARDPTRGDLPLTAIPNKFASYAADPTVLVADLTNYATLPEGTDLTDPATLGALSANTDLLVQTAITALLAEAQDADRSLLGETQLAWLSNEVASSNATWQVVGQQVLMNQMYVPSALLLDQTGTATEAFGTILQKLATGTELTAEESALYNSTKLPYNLDAWDGYIAEREAVAAILADTNAVVLAGDTHNAWYGDVKSQITNEAFAKQFATPGVSAPGFESLFADQDPDLLATLWTTLVDGLEYANTESRGYLDITFTPDEVTGTWVYVDVVGTTDYKASTHIETYSLA